MLFFPFYYILLLRSLAKEQSWVSISQLILLPTTANLKLSIPVLRDEDKLTLGGNIASPKTSLLPPYWSPIPSVPLRWTWMVEKVGVSHSGSSSFVHPFFSLGWSATPATVPPESYLFQSLLYACPCSGGFFAPALAGSISLFHSCSGYGPV